MKVALVHDWLNGMRGGEKVLEGFCNLFPQAHIYTLLYEPKKVSDIINRHPVTASSLMKIPGFSRYYRYFLPVFPLAVGSFSLDGYDLVVSSSHCVAKGVHVSPSTPHICYCFTPMRYIWDLRDSYFGRGIKAAILWPILKRLQQWDVASSRRVDAFVSISQTVSQRIKRYYGRSSDIIHPPVDTDFYTPIQGSAKDGDPFYLIVSSLVPYKRIDLAVDAFSKHFGPECQLVIIGSGSCLPQLRKRAGKNVTFMGWQPDHVLRSYYRRARALLFPGVEDFGIVPLEAQACGTPVIAFAAGGLKETIVAGRTGTFFQEQTPRSLAAAVREFDKVYNGFSSQIIREHSLLFSKQVFARRLKEYFNSKLQIGNSKLQSEERENLLCPHPL